MTRGGARPGAGRPPRTDAPTTTVLRVPVSEAEHAELRGALRDGEPLAELLREAGLREARRRDREAERRRDDAEEREAERQSAERYALSKG